MAYSLTYTLLGAVANPQKEKEMGSRVAWHVVCRFDMICLLGAEYD